MTAISRQLAGATPRTSTPTLTTECITANECWGSFRILVEFSKQSPRPIDYIDSLVDGHGDLQKVTTGRGDAHRELCRSCTAPNPTGLYCIGSYPIWLNLPAVRKMVDPVFVMH